MPLHKAPADFLLQIPDLQLVQFRLFDERHHGGGSPSRGHVEIFIQIAVMIAAIEAPPLLARCERDADQTRAGAWPELCNSEWSAGQRPWFLQCHVDRYSPFGVYSKAV
jgi:hypothetical protein